MQTLLTALCSSDDRKENFEEKPQITTRIFNRYLIGYETTCATLTWSMETYYWVTTFFFQTNVIIT